MKYIMPRLLLIAASTALLAKAAYIERGYFSVGIEYIAVFAVLFIWVGICTE